MSDAPRTAQDEPKQIESSGLQPESSDQTDSTASERASLKLFESFANDEIFNFSPGSEDNASNPDDAGDEPVLKMQQEGNRQELNIDYDLLVERPADEPILRMQQDGGQVLNFESDKPINDDLEITFGEERGTKTAASDSEAGQLDLSDVKELYNKISSSNVMKTVTEAVKDSVAPYIEPAYEALVELSSEGGQLDTLAAKTEARRLATNHNSRYEEMLNGERSRTYEERGLITQQDGSSYRIDDNGRLTEITFAQAEGEDRQAKYSNIKYDEDGKLKQYQVASGHMFTRQSPEDENGFAQWKCTFTDNYGRIHNTNYSGSGSSIYNANVQIDENGASIMIGKPVSDANREFEGNMYFRSSAAERTNSTPVRDEGGEITGITTSVNVEGEATSLNARFDRNGDLKPEFAPTTFNAIDRLYDGIRSLTQNDGMLDTARKSMKARSLANTLDERYDLLSRGPHSRVFDAPGTTEQADGSSYEVGENNRIESFTHAQVGDTPPYKITDIKYDDSGHLESYVDQQGYLFERSSDLDENGFGIWKASKDGVDYNYSGTGTKEFRANMMIDEHGLTKLIGAPLPGQSHDAEGRMYWRNSDNSTVHSRPQRNESGELLGIDSEITLAGGEKFTRSSSLDENSRLESNLDLAQVEEKTPEQIERNKKVEEIKDKIESLEDPVLELTNAFKKFEQIGNLELHRDRDGSYKANIQYNGPSWMPSQFNGPVSYKKGRPVWSKGMSLNPNISFNFRPTNDGVMIDRMSGVFSSASWKGIHASGPQNWMQLGKSNDGTPYMRANTTSTGSKKVLFWTFSRTENNTNTFTAGNFKHGSGMRSFLSDSSAVDGLNGALRLFENADVSSLAMTRPDRTKPENFDVAVRFNSDREIKLDEKLEGPLELDSIKLAKDLKFKIRQGADGADRDSNPDSVEIDATGITANIQIAGLENGIIPVQPTKVTIAKDAQGRAVLQMHIESDQIKKLQSANLQIGLNNLDKIQSGKVTLVNVPLLKALSGTAMEEMTKVAESIE